jgi:histidinol-phosphate aminotransferase
LPVEAAPTRGNFVLVDLGREAKSVFEALMRRGVIVRPMAGYGLPTCLRVSVGTEEENAMFLDALTASLDESVGVSS